MTFINVQTKANVAVIQQLANSTLSVNGVEMRGIFGKEYVESNFTESQKPVFTGLSSDLEIIEHGDNVYIDFNKYKIVNIRPNGTGMTSLILELQ